MSTSPLSTATVPVPPPALSPRGLSDRRTRRELIFDPFKLHSFSAVLQKARKQRFEHILVLRCSKSADVLVLLQAFCSKAGAKLVAPALSYRAEEGLDGLRCRWRRLFIVTSRLLAITSLFICAGCGCALSRPGAVAGEVSRV